MMGSGETARKARLLEEMSRDVTVLGGYYDGMSIRVPELARQLLLHNPYPGMNHGMAPPEPPLPYELAKGASTGWYALHPVTGRARFQRILETERRVALALATDAFIGEGGELQ